MFNLMKTIWFFPIFSLLILYGCASWGIHNSYGEKIEFSVDDLVEGNIRLVCGVNCSVKYIQMRAEIKKLLDNEEWLDLARQVSEIGYEIDQAYYYLGRSSEGLGSYDAARTYYALALTSPKCGGFFDICSGIKFPKEIEARKVLIIASEEAVTLEEHKIIQQGVKSNLTEEQVLYKEVKKIPSRYIEKNRDGYKKLMAINPSNQTYKKKYFYYNKLSENKKHTLYKEKSILTDEQVLYAEVKKIPSRYIEKNRDGYKKLMEMNPKSQTYKKKYFYYSKLYKNKTNSHYNEKSESNNKDYDKDLVTIPSNKKEKIGNNPFAKTVKDIEASGAFTKDPGKSSIYIEADFWNAMSSHQKDGFCYMLQKTYPMYAQSILEKYSGRKLAETNIHGELGVIQ